MEKSISKYAPVFYSILRIVAGLLFSMHGSQKLFGVPGVDGPVELFSLMGIGGVVEFLGGLLIMIGLFTRPAAFLASGQMAVAFFMVHLPQHPLPILNHGETAVLNCFIFLYIFVQGAGIWSVDDAPPREKIFS